MSGPLAIPPPEPHAHRCARAPVVGTLLEILHELAAAAPDGAVALDAARGYRAFRTRTRDIHVHHRDRNGTLVVQGEHGAVVLASSAWHADVDAADPSHLAELARHLERLIGALVDDGRTDDERHVAALVHAARPWLADAHAGSMAPLRFRGPSGHGEAEVWTGVDGRTVHAPEAIRAVAATLPRRSSIKWAGGVVQTMTQYAREVRVKMPIEPFARLRWAAAGTV